VSGLEQRALVWIAPYWNADHLVRTRDWAMELEPDARPSYDPATMAPDDEEYQRAHSERSARIVTGWLRAEGADEQLVGDVGDLVLRHECGGGREADVLQAADSISFLEINKELPFRWARQGRCTMERGLEHHRWMFERIRLEDARKLAQPFYEQAVALAA
jgi:hypothetical protein